MCKIYFTPKAYPLTNQSMYDLFKIKYKIFRKTFGNMGL